METTGREEWAIVLDYLPNGYPFEDKKSFINTPIVQAIGKEHFMLLELVPKKEVSLQPASEVYIGEGKRDQIHHINGRLSPSRLTSTARTELEFVLGALIRKNEARFIEFFNKAQPLSTRMHSLELLPGMGKKRMWELIEERENKPFTGFEEMRKRVKLMPDPEKLIVKRIILELEGKEKHYLFIEA